MSEIYKGESGYLKMLEDVVDGGVFQTDRTGVGVRSIFDAKIIYKEGEFPFFTHRMISPRLAFEEMWFFLRGETDTKKLEARGVNFWKGNTSREFLDNRGLDFLPEGDMGAAYSKQWRDSGGWYPLESSRISSGVDQLSELVGGLKEDKYSRRHIVTLWNPSEQHLMPLTPCWWSSQYIVLPLVGGGDVLHMKVNNRSLDIAFGCPFALMQYRMFQMALCKMFGFKLGKMSADLSHIHVYENQIPWVEELLTRNYHWNGSSKNTIKLDKEIRTLDELLKLEYTDWSVEYLHFNSNKWEEEKPTMAI